MKKYFFYLPHFLLGLGIFFLGVFSGIFYQMNEQTSSFTPITSLEKEKISVLNLTQISPFGVEGNVNGNTVRLSDGKQILEIRPGENFQINTSEIFRNVQLNIPEGTQFFASKKGKKFYPISNTKQLETLRPENILFFKSAEEALKAGKIAEK